MMLQISRRLVPNNCLEQEILTTSQVLALGAKQPA